MKKYILTIFQYLFFVCLGFFFVWLSVKDIHEEQWAQIKDALSRAKHWLVIPALLLLLLSHYSRALRWKILMEPMGYKPSNFNVFAAVMIGYLVNAGVPRLGEVVKCSMLARYEKVRVDRLVGTIVMERAVDVICLLVVFASALIFQGDIINEHIGAKFTSLFRDASGHTSSRKVLVVLGSLALFLLLSFYLLRKFAHVNAVAKIKHVLAGILHGLSSIRQVQHKGLFLFHTIFIWLCYLAGTTIGIYSLQETSHLGIGGGVTALALGSVGMLIAPGGIGAYAWIVAKLMGWYGLDEDTIGNALGWLLWSFQTLIILIGGLVCFGLLSYFNKNKKSESSEQPAPKDSNA
ncbi:MAG: flippase-like protein [Flaviaesturariibacter sp.]|nr:flippase-like protein [Flaviaesturariibacter sp.]